MFSGRPRRSVFALAAPDHLLPWTLALVLPAIALDHVLHTEPAALLATPVYQLLHWLGDSLLALPLGAFAVWAGLQLADRLGWSGTTPSDTISRALLCAAVFALALVPGAVLHEQTDALTHAQLLVASHVHTLSRSGPTDPTSVLAAFVAHALSDGVQAQLLGFPALLVAMSWRNGAH